MRDDGIRPQRFLRVLLVGEASSGSPDNRHRSGSRGDPEQKIQLTERRQYESKAPASVCHRHLFVRGLHEHVVAACRDAQLMAGDRSLPDVGTHDLRDHLHGDDQLVRSHHIGAQSQACRQEAEAQEQVSPGVRQLRQERGQLLILKD